MATMAHAFSGAVPPLPVPHATLLSPFRFERRAQEHAEQVQGIAALTPYARCVAWDRVRVERRSSAAPITGTPVTLIGRHDAGMIEPRGGRDGKMRRWSSHDRPGGSRTN